ncbi:MAG: hypothetical protein KKE17_04230 [Proteobacteria bacterium]|nr:hypothetical protein [Pseudomonadota bacterium]MBU1709193.1 hypothetical protein [Pseudomonadota bacterium]
MHNTPQVEQHPLKTIFRMNKGIDIIPFYENDGTQNFSDRYMAQVFRRIVREETIYKVFYDGSVRNTTDFIEFFRDKGIEMFFVEFNGKEAGFFWINKFKNKSAFINYCYYRDFWGGDSLEISKLTIEFIFGRKNLHGEHLVDVLLGLTPANNKLAIQFLLKNGMTIIGKVPGMLYDSGEGINVDGIFSYKQRNPQSSLAKITSFLFFN